jgi:hypothetical protein
MNLRSVFNVFFLLVIMLSSCKEDEMEDIQIMANAGPVQNVKLNDLVTLNGSASSGPEGMTYSWTYEGDVPEADINFQNKNTEKPTFTPTENGVYSFTLTVSANGITDTDHTAVVSEGVLASAGENQNVQTNSVVILDGSESIGPEGITYSWTYQGDVPEADINFQNKNTEKPTFTPPLSGVYNFTLTVSANGMTDTDNTSVFVEGAFEIGGVITEDLILTNIAPNAEVPDYLVTSDLIIPNGLKLAIIEDEVVIEFQPRTGIIVEKGGLITNVTDEQDYTFNTEFRGDNWKGIWINNGSVNMEQAIIVNAGKEAFEGMEPSAVVFSGSEMELISFSNNEFVGSNMHDILVTDKFPEAIWTVKSNKLSAKVPIKAPITFMNTWAGGLEQPNIMPDTYDYIHLLPGGANVKDEIVGDNQFYFSPAGAKFYIDGDFWSGSRILLYEGTTIYMKENSGIMTANFASTSLGSPNNMATITGLDGARWKGIYLSDENNNTAGVSIHYAIIENAGYGIISMGGITAKEEASIYANKLLVTIKNSEIRNSGGYGIYNEREQNFVSMSITNTTFRNTTDAAIYMLMASVGYSNYKDSENVFEMNPGVAAIEAVSVEGIPISQNWYDLGNDNYYLMSGNLRPAGLRLNEGVHLKFKSGTYVKSVADEALFIKGSAEKPVIIEGETDSPGSWGGMYLFNYRAEHLIVKNGGGMVIPDAPGPANIISNYTSVAELIFNNVSIVNSAGWGMYLDIASQTPDFENQEANITFSGNASGEYTFYQ